MLTDEKLSTATSGFALAAGITALVNTALSCAKDAYAPFKDFLKSLTDHDWTTQGLIDLALFAALGLIFTTTRVGDKIHPSRLIAGLVGAVVVAGLGLAGWFALV
ncbi:MAG TPA: hypothetical protein VK686_11110 [Bryobacteraceae bacterium]|jgi:hypothetical protein|nr:hypothetical protein [Bryobacteraceae bacterium]